MGAACFNKAALSLTRFDTRPQDVELCLRVVATLDPGKRLISFALAHINEDQAAKVKILSHALEVVDRVKEDRAQCLACLRSSCCRRRACTGQNISTRTSSTPCATVASS
ncbi:hypothetical protein WJX75_002143 [Coccomyxa subellipsoidea]|uniref:Uncharacterized protein n=1 Tax=Coccomyxa subellipsoidea TaxID=248742 RepID=A0ABR2Z1W5_9CHLO